METVNFKFIIELPNGEKIISKEYEYEYNKERDIKYENTHSYNMMLEDVEQDKIAFVFQELIIRQEQINK